MYLSRVRIDTEDRRKIRDLSHLGAYHSWVEESFPKELEAGVRSRKLWRLDRLESGIYLLVVSRERPVLPLLEKYGTAGSAETKDYDPFLAALQSGGSYRFRAVLNPVQAVSQGAGRRGRVYPLLAMDRQLQYLRERAEQHGFSLKPGEYTITERDSEILKKSHERPVRLVRAAYEGRLTVTDAEKFREALTDGIGRKKAYGFGMMTVIPERQQVYEHGNR